MRLLFLAALVLAFAQPFFSKDANKQTGSKLQVIYLDNSYSMSVKNGARRVLDIAKDAARKQVLKAPPGTRFILLTNEKTFSYHAEPADKVYKDIMTTEASAAAKTVNQVLANVQSILLQSEQGVQKNGADVYYYSDFQQSSFAAVPDKALMQHVTFHGLPVQNSEAQNIYIDTAWLTTPVLQTGKTNYIVVRTHCTGEQPKESPVLNLIINNQVKSAASLSFTDKKESIDTLGFQVNNGNWQNIMLTVNDLSMRFDDTFRVTARSATTLSILVLNQGQPSPYIQAAFRAYNGFRLNQVDVMSAPADWKEYNLVILNGVTRIDEALGKTINEALQQGQSICIFPGRTSNLESLNAGLRQAGDINIAGIDTAAQMASSIQQGSALVKDLFDKIPDNVQLPVANWHYVINAGLGANRQSVLSFRNGDPLLARYTPSKGQLYICATAADLQSGNFPASYFFTPFLYQMAMQGGGSSIYAVTAGTQQPVYLSMADAAGRSTVHVYGNNIDVIPPQRPNGAGLDVYIDQVVQQPGFYAIGSPEVADTTQIALNQDKRESLLDFRNINALKSEWKADNIKWLNITENGAISDSEGTSFPLWKICVFLAIAMLAVETWLLARKQVVVAA